jgi:hypothetical protein
MVSTNQLEDSMQTFQLNDQAVRFSQAENFIYLVTSDANKAFGFDGKNTAIDNVSIRLDELAKYETFILSGEDLAKNTLIVELKDLLRVIVRSNKSELELMQDVLMQQLAKAFAQNFGMQTDRPMLPATSDNDRVQKLAGSVAGRKFGGQGQDLIDLPDWQTVTQMLGELGESIEDENSLAKNDEFRFWINRNMSDIYRAQFGEEPPTVDRKITKEAKTRAYGYPPSFFGLVKLFLSEWINRRG